MWRIQSFLDLCLQKLSSWAITISNSLHKRASNRINPLKLYCFKAAWIPLIRANNLHLHWKMLQKTSRFQPCTAWIKRGAAILYWTVKLHACLTKVLKCSWVNQAAKNLKGLLTWCRLSAPSKRTSTSLWFEATFGRWRTELSANFISQSLLHIALSSHLKRVPRDQVKRGPFNFKSKIWWPSNHCRNKPHTPKCLVTPPASQKQTK